MKRVKIVLGLVIAAMLLSLSSAAYALVPGTEQRNPNEMGVKNSEGDYVGTVKDALVDGSGNIAFVIVYIAQEKKVIAVPLAVFSYDHESKTLVVDVSKELISAAPNFDASELSDPGFAERVYRFFGLMPAWGEGTPEGGE